MQELKVKKFWKSRTFWVALLGAVSSFTANYMGYEIPAHVQVMILSTIVFVLRLDTKTPIQF
jgi:hypothetical protein